MIFNIGIGKPKSQMPPVFTCTGTEETDYLFRQEQGTNNWELAILKNCTINFSRVGPVDIFLAGGGKPGTNGSVDGVTAFGGAGGNGGERVTQSKVTLTEGTDYSITIGGSNSSTSGFGYTATSGGGSSGGQGGQVSGNSVIRNSAAGSNGAYAFGASTSLIYSGRLYGAGGGGAHVRTYYDGSYWTAEGERGGGSTGGGTGGSISSKNGSSATTGNTGAGGGGAARSFDAVGTPGNGDSGIIIIRNARGGGT